MCGEKFCPGVIANSIKGSPPRVRGKAIRKPKPKSAARITPACAGKSAVLAGLVLLLQGSPPRVRGKAAAGPVCPCAGGITPACAGKSAARPGQVGRLRDHPRVCGEKTACGLPWLLPWGSPPRVRGKENINDKPAISCGITPACAGKRLKRSRSTVLHAAIVPLFPSVCNKLVGSDGSPAGHDAPPFLPLENAAPASPAYNLRSL